MRIDIAGLQFNMDAPDEDGTYWYITEMEGWDSPNLRQSFGAPASQHGAVVLESLLDSRAITVRGIIKAITVEHFWTAYNLLSNLVPLWTPADFVVYEHQPKRAGVIRGGPIRLTWQFGTSCQFEIPMIAPDPRKYATGDTEQAIAADQTVVVTNTGTAATPLVVTVTAAGTVELVNQTTGQRLATSTLGLGSVIDFKARTITTSGGANAYGALDPTSTWWSLAPGDNSILNSGTAAVQVTYRNTWS